jgi:hypothetical protein
MAGPNDATTILISVSSYMQNIHLKIFLLPSHLILREVSSITWSLKKGRKCHYVPSVWRVPELSRFVILATFELLSLGSQVCIKSVISAVGFQPPRALNMFQCLTFRWKLQSPSSGWTKKEVLAPLHLAVRVTTTYGAQALLNRQHHTLSIVAPIYKKGDKTDCNSYQGISLLSITCKSLSNMLPLHLAPT